MAEPKTRPTDASVEEFLDAVPVARRREDGRVVAAMMAEISGEQPVMWGPSIIGYGETELVNKSGANMWPVVGFSPRKTELVLYLEADLDESLYERLGAHRRSVACLYIKRLDQVDLEVLGQLIEASVARTRAAGS